MKDEVYTQCKLAKDNVTQVAFIPSCFAKFGELIMIRNKEGVWENGWAVIEVYQTLSKESALTQERAHVRHRKTTDI